MELSTAFDIVYQLAKAYTEEKIDIICPESLQEVERNQQALAVIHDFIINNLHR